MMEDKKYYLAIAHSTDENNNLIGTEVLLFRAKDESRANFIAMALVLITGDEWNSRYFDDALVNEVPLEHFKVLQRYFRSYSEEQVDVTLQQAAKLIAWVENAVPELEQYEFLNMLRKNTNEGQDSGKTLY